MALVDQLSADDNKASASATAQVTAQRIGKSLRGRFEDNIHKRECSPGSNGYDDKMASRAISAFSIFHLAGTDEIEAAESVCDSSDDGGIDSLFVNHNDKCVVVVQAKFNKSGSSTWSISDFLRFKNACEQLQRSDYKNFDEILVGKSADIEIALGSIDYTFKFVMAHTGKRGAAEPILSEMKDWQSELNIAAVVSPDTPPNQLPFQVHLVSAEDLVEWMRIQNSNTVDLEEVEIEQYGKVNEPMMAYYGVVSGDQILEWWEQHSTKLFTKNIRNLLGKTDVNDSIQDTIINSPSNFWYYNNGITVLVRGVTPHRRNQDNKRATGKFNFQDISIINGAQTVSTIGKVGAVNPVSLPDIKVHARFILVPETDGDHVINLITRANNHQNRVLGRDFASQHPEQLRLRDELIIEGYTYRLLRTDSDSTSQDTEIDIDEALAGLACFTRAPTTLATLKSARGKFFENLEGNQYKTIFNPRVSGIKLINVVRHHRFIDRLIKEELESTDYATEKKKYGILTHANRVFAAELMSLEQGLKKADTIVEVDEENIKRNFNKLLEKTEVLIESCYPTAYPARFFSNSQKITIILDYFKTGVKPSQEEV